MKTIVLCLLFFATTRCTSLPAAAPSWAERHEMRIIYNFLGAAAEGNVRKVTEMFDQGLASKEICDYTLFEAARTGENHIIRFLIGKGANPNIRRICGLTPLHEAAMHRRKDTVALLIALGASPHMKTICGRSPKNLAIEKLKAEKSYRDPDCDAIEKWEKIIARLSMPVLDIFFIPDPLAPKEFYLEAFFDCVERGLTHEVGILLGSGVVSINERNQYGDTPLDRANEEDDAMIALLRAHGGEPGFSW